jgi:hypothetical protein
MGINLFKGISSRYIAFLVMFLSIGSVNANFSEMMTAQDGGRLNSSKFSEGVDYRILHPSVNHVDVSLQGRGPDITVQRFYDGNIFENNYFGSWSLATDSINITVRKTVSSSGMSNHAYAKGFMTHKNEELGLSVEESLPQLCELITQESNLGNSPYFIKDGKKDLLVLNEGADIRSVNSKWKFTCNYEGGLSIIGTSPNGDMTVFKPKAIGYDFSTTSYIELIPNTYPYSLYDTRTAREAYTVIEFYPETLSTPNGHQITSTYDIETVGQGTLDYNGTGLCRSCRILPKKIFASDGRVIDFYYTNFEGEPKSVIDYITYGNSNSSKTISYEYGKLLEADYLVTVRDDTVVWSYGYNIPELFYFTRIHGRASYDYSYISTYPVSSPLSNHNMPYYVPGRHEMIIPLYSIRNNYGYSASYTYNYSQCTGKIFNDELNENSIPAQNPTLKLDTRTIKINGVESNYQYYFEDEGEGCARNLQGGNEYLGNNYSELNGTHTYRSIEILNDKYSVNYYSRDFDGINFGKHVASEVFLNEALVDWSKSSYIELDNEFRSIESSVVDRTLSGYVVLEKAESANQIIEYNYSNNYISNTTGNNDLLDAYGNPSKVTYTAKNINPLIQSGYFIPTSEIRLTYDYISDYGFYVSEKRRRYYSKLNTQTDIVEMSQELDSKFNRKFEVSNGVTTSFHYDENFQLKYKDVGSFNTHILNETDEIPVEHSNAILRTAYSNYQFGKPWLITHPNRLTTEYEFNVFGEKLYEKDTTGIETRFDYVNGLLKTKRNLSSYYSDVSYDYIFDQPHGYTATETYTDILGDIIKTTKFNGASKPISIEVSGVGDSWYKTFDYDSSGNTAFESVISQNASSSSGVEYKYDGLNRLLERLTRDEDGGSTLEESICYGMECESKDSNASSYGNFKIITKKSGETVYDFIASLDQDFVYEKQVNPNGLQPLKLQYTYMGNGLPQTIDIDDGTLNKAVSLAYWANSTQLRYYDDYETPKLSYQYNAQGELKNVSNTLDGGSYSQSKTYSEGILDFITYGDGKIEDYEYYLNGRLKYSEVDGNKHSYTYDDDGYLEFEEFEYPDTETYKVSYKYNQLGSLKEYTLPNNKVVTVNLDAIQGIGSLISDDVKLTFKQKAQNRLQEMFYGESGDSIENVFDALLRLDDVKHNQYSASSTLLDLDYDTSKGLVSDYINPQSAQSYEIDYDDKGRLSNVIDKNNVNHDYSYQFMSDLNEVVRDLVVQDYEYAEGPTSKELTKFNGKNISYDENANINGFADAVLNFDSRNLLTNYSNGALSNTYSYFAEGSRASEKIGNSSDIREIRSSALGSLVYTDDVIQNKQEELFYLNNQLMARHTICSDTDNDGLNDCHEDVLGTNKNVDNRDIDTDGDGIFDIAEIELGLNFNSSDSDGDYIDDGIDPNPAEFTLDIDGDGLSNQLEVENGGDPLVANFDFDGDGVSNADEKNLYSTNPVKADTDNDGLPDLYEINNNTNPNLDINNGDYDLDGVQNAAEISLGLNPLKDFSNASKSDFSVYVSIVMIPILTNLILM